MTNPGRNQPCHCGSGIKYKKCCLKKDEDSLRDEQDLRDFEYAVRQGYIDPLASDEDWEAEPELEWPGGDFDADVDGDDEEFGDWYDELDNGVSRIPLPHASDEYRSKYTDEELRLADSWWDEMENMTRAEDLHAHIGSFMDQHPQLVRALGLEVEPMPKLYFDCLESCDYQPYFDMVARLRRDFPDVYKDDFPSYDKFMVQWLLKQGQKEHVAEYLDDFLENPAEDAEALREVVDCLLINNCNEILADFIPGLYQAVEASACVIDEVDLRDSMLTLTLAPFLDRGLDNFEIREITKALGTMKDTLPTVWEDEESIQDRLECILGKERSWSLADCPTRFSAIVLYGEVGHSFMGWLHRNKALDWSAASYYREAAQRYLYRALPMEKRPCALFPLKSTDIAIVFQRFIDDLATFEYWDYFAMLNSTYWFVEFLEETQGLDHEDAAKSKNACRNFFDHVWRKYSDLDFGVQFWEKFPREI